MTDKAQAYKFLKTLQAQLNQKAPRPEDIRALVDPTWSKPKDAKSEGEKLESKENIAFYAFAMPQIFELGKMTAGLTDHEMRRALPVCVLR